MRLISSSILTSLIFVGCSFKEVEVEYRNVYIPVRCDVPKRERPKKSNSIAENFKRILIYTEILEKDLKVCRGEE